jgi:N-acetylmuramoyl-L-alanine amidase
VLFALAFGVGCRADSTGQGADAGLEASSVAAAEALVGGGGGRGGAPLPARFETVGLADAVAVASLRARPQGDPPGRSPESTRLARLAADLRARLWRFDQIPADAREAIELYAEVTRLAAGTEEGCEAERLRALLAGELARDAAAAYRELYLASRRQAALTGPAAGRADADRRAEGARSRCLTGFDLTLAQAIAYRPSGEAMRALERNGNAIADAALKGTLHADLPAQGGAPQDGGGAAKGAQAAGSATGGPAATPAFPDVIVSPGESAASKGPVKLVSIEPYGGEQGARVVIHLSAPTTFQVGTLAADDATGKDARIFLDIARARAKGIPREKVVGGVVRRVRVGDNGGSTRVVLDLAAALYRRIFYLPDPFRIVIDLSTRPPVTEDKPGAGGSRNVRRVALDPGHGGSDAGAVGPTGLREKDVTLDIAHRVAPLLAHELKVETLLTRDNDSFVPLDLRTARANAFHADLFISIHCNASENGKATGVQTFILDEAKDPEGTAARVAARENADQKRAAVSAESAAELSLVLSNLNVGEMTARSRHVADLLQRSALGSLLPRYPDTKDQGIKTAGFFVLVGADMPAALFETAFISNPEDEGRLATADYRQKLADAIVNAIRAYKAGK